MEERNPSPPRVFQDEADKFRQDMIGSTTISKKWIYSTLLNLCKEVEKHNTEEEVESVDVSEDLQDEACRLWDLCIESELAVFLIGAKAINIFSGIILKSNSPRLTEISVGILGNMVCTSEACGAITEDENLPHLLVSLLSCRDSPTLVEVTRLLSTCLSNEEHRDTWISILDSTISDSGEDILFILNSSSNNTVLKNLLEVLDNCLDLRPDLINKFLTIEFAHAVVEAGTQLFNNEDSANDVMHCLHLLQTLTTVDNSSILKGNLPIISFSIRCCESWCGMDDFFVGENPSSTSVASCLSLINFLLEISLPQHENANFFENISETDKKHIILLCQRVHNHCKTFMDANVQKETNTVADVDKNVENEKQDSKPNENPNSMPNNVSKDDENATEKVHELVDRSNEDKNIFNDVILLDVVNDLFETIKRLEWSVQPG